MGNFFLKLFFKNKKEIIQPPSKGFFDLILPGSDDTTIKMSVLGENRRAFLFVNISIKSTLSKKNFIKLQQLYGKYKSRGLVVIAFPCDQFWTRNPDSSASIAAMLKDRYSVTFPILGKVRVNGKNTDEIYRYLRYNLEFRRNRSQMVKTVPWSFSKFLVDPTGTVVKFYGPLDDFGEIERGICDILYFEGIR